MYEVGQFEAWKSFHEDALNWLKGTSGQSWTNPFDLFALLFSSLRRLGKMLPQIDNV
jgi:hypothetical protein